MSILEDVLALAIVVAFVVLLVPRWRTLFGDDRKIFSRNFWTYGSLFGERLDAAIARRMALESIDRRVLWGIAVCEIIALAAKMFHLISTADMYALAIVIFVAGVAVQTITTRRNGRLYVAMLRPREPMRAVPWWLFGLPLAVWVAGFIATLPTHAFFPIGVTLAASLASFYASLTIARAPAILGAKDPQMDEIVDEKVRAYRMRFVLIVGAMAPLALAFVLQPSSAGVRLLCACGFVVLATWSKREVDFTPEEVASIASSKPNPMHEGV